MNTHLPCPRLSPVLLQSACIVAALLLPLSVGPAVAAVGWRTDTTGCYTNATPPTDWAADRNIAWKTPLPGPSSSTPLLVNRRILLLADPDLLLCIDSDGGRVLWQKSNPTSSVTIAESHETFKAAAAERHRLWEQVEALKKQKDELTALQKATPSDEQATKIAALEKQVKELDAKRERLPKLEGVKANEGVGLTCCTPVSDGAVVFALFNNGVGACYDLDGKLKWSRFFRPPAKGYGQSMSPVLAGDIVGVHVDDDFYAIALSDGRLLWQEPELQHQGSPVSLDVGGTWVFLTTDGNVRRAADGKLVTKLGFPSLNLFTTPVVNGTTATWIAENKFLVTASFTAKEGTVSVKKTHINIPKGLYYASPLITDGCAWLCNNVDYKLDKMRLYVVDTSNGKVLKDEPLGVSGWAYPSPTLAGGLVYLAGDKGVCRVLRPGWTDVEVAPGETRREFQFTEVAKNTLEPFRCCPVFDGRRLYIRGLKNLYAIEQASAPKP